MNKIQNIAYNNYNLLKETKLSSRFSRHRVKNNDNLLKTIAKQEIKSDKDIEKELKQLGVINKILIKKYTPGYKEIPEYVAMILQKNHEDSRMGFMVDEIVPYAFKAKKYEKEISEITGNGFEGLTASSLKDLIQKLEKKAK